MNAVWFRIKGMPITLVLFPVAKVYPACQLANDVKICASADLGFERGCIYKGIGSEETGP